MTKRLLALTLALVLALGLFAGCGKTEPEAPAEPEPQQTQETPAEPEPQETAAYLDAVGVDGGFLAAGTGGRLDGISFDGTVTARQTGTTADIRCLWNDDTLCLAGTADGSLLISEDNETFSLCAGVVPSGVNGVAMYNGMIYAACDDGKIYATADLDEWQTFDFGLTEPLIALVATHQCLAAVSASTDVLISFDGTAWDQSNFNEVYDGLYPPYTFVNAIGAGETFFVMGYESDRPNVPTIMYTETGEVWMQKALAQINNEDVDVNELLRVNDLAISIDQIFGACSDGKLLTVTECIKCNQMRELPDEGADLRAVAVSDDTVLAVGDGLYYQVFAGDELRQDRIQAEQAQIDIANGAVVIDVRTQEERDADGYIPGSLHIPVDEIEAQLPTAVPDPMTEIIFYCASGGRAQTAMETAEQMGYLRVYNLGGLSDWPYEIAHD